MEDTNNSYYQQYKKIFGAFKVFVAFIKLIYIFNIIL